MKNLSPATKRFYARAIVQQERFVNGEITKDQLMWNLRTIERDEGAVGVDWDIWKEDGYVLPWERQEEVALEAMDGGGG